MQRTTLLASKFRIPPARHNVMARSRLYTRLDAALSSSLTLLSAPAGSGKTTLLAEWIHDQDERQRTKDEGQEPNSSFVVRRSSFVVSWLSLDSGDDDLERFIRYFCAALNKLQPEINCSEEFLDALQSIQTDSLDSGLTPLLNALDTIPHESVLILDDYHEVTSPAVHEVVSLILEHLPPQLHVVIATRMTPPLPLARLRAQGRLLELGASDLRLTREEMATFLSEVMGLRLTETQVQTLEERTEGWVAGLKLAALSMQGREDIDDLIARFTGNHYYILDYLTAEVLGRQPAEVQEFMLETSILGRLCAPLCNAVTGRDDAQGMIEYLDAANLFVIALDDERRWYRYHHLFRELLHSRLHLLQADRERDLHRAAAEWHASQDMHREAIHHAIEGQDYRTAMRLIAQVADSLWAQSDSFTLLNWFQRIPKAILATNPSLCIQAAWAYAVTGQLEEVEFWIEASRASGTADSALHMIPSAEAESGRRELALSLETYSDMLHAFVARFDGRVSDAITYSKRALARIGKEDISRRAMALLYLGHAYLLDGNSEAASRTLIEASQLSLSIGQMALYLSVIHYLAQLRILQGRLNEAMAIYQQGAQALTTVDQRALAGIERIGMGDILREWNQLEAAERYIDEGLQLAETGGDFVFVRDGYIARARLERARGNLEGTIAFLQEAEQIAYRSKSSTDAAVVQGRFVRVWIALGNTAAAEYWAQTSRLGPDDPLDYLHEFSHIVLARVLLAQARFPAAEHLLTRLREFAAAGGRTGRVIEITMLQALLHQARGDLAAATETLLQALEFAAPEGYMRLFVDEGPAMQSLLVALRDARTRALKSANGNGHSGLSESVAAYLDRLLAAFPAPADARQETTATIPNSASTPLSERELEILALIAAGRSYQEIARTLMITLSTVQTHIRNIYRKLDVHSATAALARARELSLLN